LILLREYRRDILVRFFELVIEYEILWLIVERNVAEKGEANSVVLFQFVVLLCHGPGHDIGPRMPRAYQSKPIITNQPYRRGAANQINPAGGRD